MTVDDQPSHTCADQPCSSLASPLHRNQARERPNRNRRAAQQLASPRLNRHKGALVERGSDTSLGHAEMRDTAGVRAYDLIPHRRLLGRALPEDAAENIRVRTNAGSAAEDQ